MDAELKGTAKAEAAKERRYTDRAVDVQARHKKKRQVRQIRNSGAGILARAAPAVRWERANPNVRSGTERTRRGKLQKSIQRTQLSDGKMMRSQGPKRTAPDEDKESRLKQTIKY